MDFSAFFKQGNHEDEIYTFLATLNLAIESAYMEVEIKITKRVDKHCETGTLLQ